MDGVPLTSLARSGDFPREPSSSTLCGLAPSHRKTGYGSFQLSTAHSLDRPSSTASVPTRPTTAMAFSAMAGRTKRLQDRCRAAPGTLVAVEIEGETDCFASIFGEQYLAKGRPEQMLAQPFSSTTTSWLRRSYSARSRMNWQITACRARSLCGSCRVLRYLPPRQ